jgi:(p)ppGpp synthase/HD superfamily hydrolase
MYGEGIPYWHHLEAVHDALVESGCADQEVLAAGWLHDILEDVPNTSPMSLLDDGVTPYTLALVDAVTEPQGHCRAVRHQLAYPRIARMQDAVLVKLADRISNVRACAKTGDSRGKMYAKEHEEFRRTLKVNGGGNFAMWCALDNEIRELRISK